MIGVYSRSVTLKRCSKKLDVGCRGREGKGVKEVDVCGSEGIGWIWGSGVSCVFLKEPASDSFFPQMSSMGKATDGGETEV